MAFPTLVRMRLVLSHLHAVGSLPLSLSPLLRYGAGGTSMGAHNRGIEHDAFHVRILREIAEHSIPHASSAQRDKRL